MLVTGHTGIDAGWLSPWHADAPMNGGVVLGVYPDLTKQMVDDVAAAFVEAARAS